MAKKKSDTNLIMSAVALVGALIAGIGLFLDVWTVFISSEHGSENLGSTKIFADWGESTKAMFCGRMFEILAIVAVVAILVSVVLSLITGKAGLITKVLNLVAIAAIVVAVICAIIFIASNKNTSILGTSGLKGAIGFYMIAIGGVIGAVAAFLTARK